MRDKHYFPELPSHLLAQLEDIASDNMLLAETLLTMASCAEHLTAEAVTVPEERKH